MQRDLDVLVSGAGPVGLFAAHSLTRTGKRAASTARAEWIAIADMLHALLGIRS